MTAPRIGALFAGYGGLEMGVQSVLGGDLAWYSEIDKGALKILTHRHPDVPNVGDVTTADWSQVEPVDVMAGGFPCQPVSGAGKRLGELDERWLWDDFALGIRTLRPGLVVLENVRGLFSARGGRLFGRVLGSLADLGYDAAWYGLRAGDIGAPHPRYRVFIVAQNPDQPTFDQRWLTAPRQAEVGGARPDAGRRGGALAANASGQRHGREQDAGLVGRLGREDPESSQQRERSWKVAGDRDAAVAAWGGYAGAIKRWERMTRPAPAPLVPGRADKGRLSPEFVEWMMGLPAGWVTDTPGITRAESLRALGNGVVPQQCAAALRALLPALTREVAV